jgi:uncharacterized protein (DUF58 family)
MQFGQSTLPKYDYARIACACLARLMLRQRDAVGLASTTVGEWTYIPPRSSAHHLQAIVDGLIRARAGGSTSLPSALHLVGKRLKRRSLIAVFSDCLDDLEGTARALRLLRLRGHEVIVFQVLAPEELHFPFNQWSRFENLESAGQRLDLDPGTIRARYLARLQAFLDDLKRHCLENRCDYVPLSTGQDLGTLLAHYLTRRASMVS